MLLKTNGNETRSIFPEDVKAKHEYLILDYLHKGAMFGENSTLNDVPNQYTVEVCSESAEIF